MGIKVSNTCRADLRRPGGRRRRRACEGLACWVRCTTAIAQMFQVIENARMMVGNQGHRHAVHRLPQRPLDFAKERVQGADLTQAADKTAPRRDDHPPIPDRTTFADDAEVVRRGRCARWSSTPPPGRDRVMVAEHNGEKDELADGGQRPAAADRQGLRLRALVGCSSAPSRCRPSAGPGFLQDYPIEQYGPRRQDRHPLRGPPPRSRARTSSSARSSRNQGPGPSGHLAKQISTFVTSEAGNGRLKVGARAARHGARGRPGRSSA